MSKCLKSLSWQAGVELSGELFGQAEGLSGELFGQAKGLARELFGQAKGLERELFGLAKGLVEELSDSLHHLSAECRKIIDEVNM